MYSFPVGNTENHGTQNNASLLSAILNSSSHSITAFKAIRNEQGHIVDFEYLFLNEVAQSMIPFSDVVGKRLLYTNPGLKTGGAFEQFVKVVEGGKSLIYEFYYDYENIKGWFRTTLVRLEDGFTSMLEDITDRKMAEIEAEKAHNFINSVLDSAPGGIVAIEAMCTPDGQVEDFVYRIANKKGEQILNRKPGELIDKRVLTEFPAAKTIGLFDKYVAVFTTGIPFSEEIFYNGEGNAWWLHVEAVKWENRGLIISFSDVTPIKKQQEQLKLLNQALKASNEEYLRSEEQLRELNNDLEKLVERRTSELFRKQQETEEVNNNLLRINADMDNFVYTISHDLKNPIGNIEGLNKILHELLAEKLGNEEKELFNMLQVSIDRLKTIIDDLTEIVRVQKDQSQPREQICFPSMVEEIKEILAPMMKDTTVRIYTDFKISCMFYARKNLRSILYNLISNAIKYRSPDRPCEIRLQTEAIGNGVHFSITDNGLGINAEQLPKVFAVFKRFHHHIEGTGLGLYVVKRIVENNDGHIEVQSTPGQGTRFDIYFEQNR